MAEFDDMLEASAGRAERALDVEESLLRLRPEIARRADDLVVDVAALLAGDISNVPRPDRLDRVIEARVLEAGRRIEKTQVSERALRQSLSGRAAKRGKPQPRRLRDGGGRPYRLLPQSFAVPNSVALTLRYPFALLEANMHFPRLKPTISQS